MAATQHLAWRQDDEATDYRIAAVDRALDLLQALARIGPASLAQVAQEARCTRTAAFRLLRTLQARGFALQDGPRGAWRLGAASLPIGAAAAAQGALSETAAPFLASLAASTGENVYLFVQDALEALAVSIHRPAQDIRIYAELGERFPLHAGAPRLLLAHAPPAVQAQMLAQRLRRFTTATRTDPGWIAADLVLTRKRGYLLARDEVVAGVTSVSVPIQDARACVVAIATIISPTTRMRPPRPRSLLAPLLETAQLISTSLGSPPLPWPETVARPDAVTERFETV